MKPTKPTSNAPLSEDEIELFGELLDTIAGDDEDAVNLEALDGYLTALATLPRSVAVAEFIDFVLPQKKPFKALEDEFLFYQLLERRLRSLAKQLSDATIDDLEDPRAVRPILVDYEEMLKQMKTQGEALPSEAPPAIAEIWANGFLSAVEDFASDWRLDESTIEDELAPQLNAFIALAFDKADWPEDLILETDEREEWIGMALWAAYEIWEYWHVYAPKAKGTTFVKPQTQADLGRNDPCFCGSGKKFKQCHGAGAAGGGAGSSRVH